MKMSTFMWHVGDGEVYECERLDDTVCTKCDEVGAITALPPPLLAKQTDGTTHVCNPAFRGCNHGFAMDEDRGRLCPMHGTRRGDQIAPGTNCNGTSEACYPPRIPPC